VFWLIIPVSYLVFLGGGLLLPGVVLWHRDPLGGGDIAIYLAAVVLMALANLMVCLIMGRILFPQYWWLGQVEGKDVFEYEGIYFLGLRLSRVPGRLQRILFGVDEQMRVWDLAFGVLFLVMLAPHTLAFLTAQQELDRRLPNPTRLAEFLHGPTLSHLPVMRDWGVSWSSDPQLDQRVKRALDDLQNVSNPGDSDRFKLAQVYILQSFHTRRRASDPYLNSPGEQIVFDRATGNRALTILQSLLDLPELERAAWSSGALSLVGLYHISDGNYQAAADVMKQAVAEMGAADESEISRYQVLLLAGQAALLVGDENGAIELLERVLLNEQLPNLAYALAMEQLSDALRLKRQWGKADEMLDKALELYKLERDRAGVARVHLHRAALALDSGQIKDATHELSIASSIASGLNDSFTLNMVARLALAFRG